MYEVINFMSGLFAFLGIAIIFITLISVFCYMFSSSLEGGSNSIKKFKNDFFAASTILFAGFLCCVFSICTHMIYTREYKIPRIEHIEYYLNNQNEFKVDTIHYYDGPKDEIYHITVKEK